MNLYDEYCYNLMESAIKSGAEGYGLSKEACVAYMNMMSGIRQAQQYIQERSQDFRKELAEEMVKGSNERTTTTTASEHQSWVVEAEGKKDKDGISTEEFRKAADKLKEN